MNIGPSNNYEPRFREPRQIDYGYCALCDSYADENGRCDCDACDYCGVRGDHEKHDGETVCAECADDMALAPVERIAPSKVAA